MLAPEHLSREGDRYFILTARHVWQDILKNGDAVGVTLREVDDHRCFIETKAITPYGPALSTPRTNLGPDIVVIEIPPSAVGTIKAMRGFYEMDGGLKAMVNGNRNEAYLLMGTPEVLGTYTPQHASVQIHGMWDGAISPFTEGEWDYFDFNGVLPEGTPGNTFGGVSGGGSGGCKSTLTPRMTRLHQRSSWKVSPSTGSEPPRAKASSVATV